MTKRPSAAADSALPNRPTLPSGAALAALVASTKAKHPTDHPDAALLALRKRYQRTVAAMIADLRPHEEAEVRYFALRAERPDLDEQALGRASGLTAAKNALDRSTAANIKITDEIFAKPAKTIEGLILKARVSESENHDDLIFWESIVNDLLAMGRQLHDRDGGA